MSTRQATSQAQTEEIAVTEFLRTADENFDDLADFPFEANYHQWHDLRMHYIDEGPKDGPVMLLMHGMPTWSYLYRHMVPLLVSAGYRCIAPDHMGFGKSDKPSDVNWYSIARHTEILSSLINHLDLNDITLLCQDWGGPIGLAQAAMMPERFTRLIVMNTWLHHPEFVYTEAIRNWNKSWHEGGLFCRPEPKVGILLPLSAGLIGSDVMVPVLLEGKEPVLEGRAADMYRGFSAPYRGLPDAAFNGLRQFPLSIPFDNYDQGNADAQNLHYKSLLDLAITSHFIWGCADDVFDETWGRYWAEQMQASFDAIPDAGHFLQHTHGAEIVAHLLRRINEE